MSTALLAPGESTFGSYGAFLRRRRTSVLGGALAGILVALAIVTLGPQTYAATTEVLVLGQVTGPAADQRATVNLDDEAQLLTSTEVLQGAAQRLGPGTAPEEIVEAVEASVAANTTVLSITYRASDPQTARRGADALAAAYLDQRQAQAHSRLDAALGWLDREQAEVEKQLQEVLVRIGRAEEQPTDRANRTVLISRLRQLRWQQADVAASVPLGGRIVSAAALPTSPRTPIPALVLISGAMAGLLAGCALGGLREYLSPRIRSAEDVARRLGAPVLTVVHASTARADLTRLATLVMDESDRPTAPARTFLVAATTPRVRGITEALAAALRQAGRETLLLRPEKPARTLIGAGRTAAAGPTGDDAQPPVSWDDEADAARERGEIVLIDGACGGIGALAPMVAEALIIVVEFGGTTPEELERAVAHLARDHHELVGIVGVTPRRSGRSPWDGAS
jgi:capsular polysaccharide biosynthesis protein